MLTRKAYTALLNWKESPSNRAMLITGARQVGKTFLIRRFGQTEFLSFIELNLILDADAASIFSTPSSARDILMRLSLVADQPLIPNDTLIFIDEVQERPEVLTAIKALVDDGRYRFILSGSLLGVELHDIRSLPVGYLATHMMYPLDFEEFCWACGVSGDVLESIHRSFENRTEIDPFVHERMLRLFHRYIVIGGMPDAVQSFVQTENLGSVRSIQEDIKNLYRADISKYCPIEDKLKAKEAYDLIPSELNNPNKRFIMKHLNERARFRDYADAFIWLTYANVALATYNVSEPCAPLQLSKERNLFKLFYSDVGLLTSSYMKSTALEVLDGKSSINYGSTYENVVAQELVAHGFDLYYYNSKKYGELDFVVADRNDTVLPIEVKSGKSYTRHKALNNVLDIPNYHIPEGYVLSSSNIHQKGNVVYLPIYLVGQFKNE